MISLLIKTHLFPIQTLAYQNPPELKPGPFLAAPTGLTLPLDVLGKNPINLGPTTTACWPQTKTSKHQDLSIRTYAL